MKSNYKQLGQFIRQVDVRNAAGKEENLLGVSVQKTFIPSIANTVGTDFTKYKVVRRGQFTYIPDTSRRGDKIGIALLSDYEEGLVSNVYTTFEVIDKNELLPEYLMLWFSRPEFDRYARFKSHGSVREVMDWDEMCKVQLPVPPISVQRDIVKAYQTITNRIALKRQVNDNLEQQAVALFKSWFVDFSLFGGTVPENWEDTTLENITTLITRGIAPKYSDNSDQTVVNQKCIRNHTIDLSLARTHTPKAINEKWLKFGDLLINSTGDGTLGRVAQVWFAPKALTVDSHVTIVRPAREELIFYIGLWGILHEKEIESLHTGSTGQTELPRDRVKMLKLLLPDNISLSRFNSIIAPMASTIILNQEENQKLASLRDTLLPKLMSGEIDVSSIQL